MIFTRRFPALFALALFAGAPAADARAQALLLPPEPPTGGRFTIDGYLSQYHLALGSTRARLDGLGARVMMALAPASGPRRERLAEHVSIGAFIAGTPRDHMAGSSDVRTTLFGAELAIRPLRAPVAGLIEPVLSLGAGLMRLEQTHIERFRLPGGEIPVPRDLPIATLPATVTERESHTMLAPAVGIQINPNPGFALRIDGRRIESDVRSQELQVGVSIRI